MESVRRMSRLEGTWVDCQAPCHPYVTASEGSPVYTMCFSNALELLCRNLDNNESPP